MDLQSKVEWVLKDAIEGGELPGGSVMILKDGKEELFAAAGYADVEAKKPYGRDTIVRVYSMSKPFTAVAVLKLLEDGIIDLADEVSRYIPSFADSKVLNAKGGTENLKRPLRIRDLVSMTAGVSYPGEEDAAALAANVLFEEVDERLFTDHAMTTLELAEKIGKLPMAFQPGTHFRYSTAADVAGAVVEAATGIPFAEYMRKEIFEPLGLKDTAFYVPAEKQDRLAKAYLYKNGKYEEEVTSYLGVRYHRDTEPAFASGGAGICSTITDYARFAAMLMNGGELDGVRILKESTVRWMRGGQLNELQKGELCDWSNGRMYGYNYGFFNRIMENPGEAVVKTVKGEYGWDGWMGTFYQNDPVNHLTMIFFTQVPGEGNTRTTRRIRNLVWGELGKAIE